MELQIEVSATVNGIEFSGMVEIGNEEHIQEQILEAVQNENPDNEELAEIESSEIEFKVTDWCDLEDFENLQDFDILQDVAGYTGNYNLEVLSACVACDLQISDCDDSYNGEWKNDEDFVQNLVEEFGYIPKDFPSWIHIDWERTAKEVMYDYCEDNGHYFRMN